MVREMWAWDSLEDNGDLATAESIILDDREGEFGDDPTRVTLVWPPLGVEAIREDVAEIRKVLDDLPDCVFDLIANLTPLLKDNDNGREDG